MTAQISDCLTFQDRRYGLSCEPLITWLWRRKNRKMNFRRYSTACSRGYSARWEICRGRFYLTSISGTFIDGTPVTLGSLFSNYSKQYLDSVGANDPANAGPGVFAFWVTGIIRCTFGKELRYEHAGYESIYEGEIHLWMRDGFLIGTRVVHRDAASVALDDDSDEFLDSEY